MCPPPFFLGEDFHSTDSIFTLHPHANSFRSLKTDFFLTFKVEFLNFYCFCGWKARMYVMETRLCMGVCVCVYFAWAKVTGHRSACVCSVLLRLLACFEGSFAVYHCAPVQNNPRVIIFKTLLHAQFTEHCLKLALT